MSNSYVKLTDKVHLLAGYIMVLYCPGCKMTHQVPVDNPNDNGAKWGWNRDIDKPTFTPSILVRYPWAGKPQVCHSFIKDGVWEFLGDCTHELAGKNVPLADIPLEEEGA